MNNRILALMFLLGILLMPSTSSATILDDSCSINIMNRTVQVRSDGSWQMDNVPSFMGRVRARATCIRDGMTISGQSEFFALQANTFSFVEDIFFDDPVAVPVSLAFANTADIAMSNANPTASLAVKAAYSDGSFSSTLNFTDGLNYMSSNADIVSVDNDGKLTAVSSGLALITVRLEGTVAIKPVTVSLGGDMDGDGLPDSFELANGLNPNDAADAFEDLDNDGLNALSEFAAGTDINNSDTDNDGITDGEELVTGTDGFITNPLLNDSDGDGFSDGLEITLETDPTDNTSFDLVEGLESIAILPGDLSLIFNGINTEVSDQLTVMGYLTDGNQVDLSASSETNYTSSDITVVNFGTTAGQIFGGVDGTADLTVTNNGYTDSIRVTVSRFDPVALSAIDIPGYANNVDVQGNYAYVAAGAKGLVIVDVSDRSSPVIVGQLDTDGIAIDIKVNGDSVYLAAGEAGVQIIDVTDKTSPVLTSTYNTAGIARDIAVDLRYIYVAGDAGGLDIINIVEPDQPFSVATLAGLGNLRGVSIDQSRLATVSDSMLHIVDISQPRAPVVLSSINVGQIKDVLIKDNHVYLALLGSGYRVFNIVDPANPVQTGGETGFGPRDLALSDGFLMFAEQLFSNAIAYVNVLDPENAVWQGNIDLSALGGSYSGNGIASDSRYTYVTAQSGAISGEYLATGTTRLFIGQHRQPFDNGRQAPFVNLRTPSNTDLLVEGTNQLIEVNAVDDVAVSEVQFVVDGAVVFSDSAAPYQMLYNIPRGTTQITLSANAVDLGGNTNSTAPVTFTIEVDTDSDGLSDNQETNVYNTSPTVADTDADGLDDGREVRIGTDPNQVDSDGDGINDGDEVADDTDPLNPDITAPTVQTILPANGSTDITQSSFIEIEFNESLSPRSVNLSVIDVREAATNLGVTGSFRLLGNNNRISFEPATLLNALTEYQVTISGVKDAAGNLIEAPFVSLFTTGNTPDTTAPFVKQISPTNNATNVPTNSIISVEFNERIKSESLNDTNIYLTDGTTNSRVAVVLTPSEDRRSVTIVPNAGFAVGRNYRLNLNRLKDLFDNQMSWNYYHFTTSFEADTEGPTLLDLSIPDGAVDIPTNAVLEMQFDEPLSGLALNGLNLRQGSNIVPLQSRTLSDGNRRVRLHLASLLEPNTAYVLQAKDTVDSSGNLQSTSVDTGFTTGSGAVLTAYLFLTDSSPYSDQGGVPLNGRITLKYNQRLNPLTLSALQLYDPVDRVNVPSDINLLRPDTIVITPKSDLVPNRSYRVGSNRQLVSLTGITDYYYNSYPSFTTTSIDNASALTVTNWSVPIDYSAMPLNGRLVLSFDAALDYLHCPVIDHVTISDGSNNIAYSWTVAETEGRQRLELIPSEALQANTSYTVTVNGLCDIAGNSLTTTVTRSFTTTADTDTTPPRLVSASPADGETGIGLNTPVVWTFSEPVLNTAYAYVYVGNHSNKLSGSLSWNADSTELTFTPSIAYPANTVIGHNIYYSYIYDLSNNVAYRYDLYSQAFTTELGDSDTVAPTVTQVIPQDGAVDINRSNRVVLSFSESLDYSTLTTENIGLYANGQRISTTVYRSYDNQSVTLDTSSVPANSVISVIVTDGVKDLAGNSLSDFISVYSTAVANETVRPTVKGVYPSNGAESVQLDKNIVLFTSEAMNIATVTSETLRVSQNGVLVTGRLVVSGDAQVITFTPDEPWSTDSIIEVFATNGLQDVAGNALEHTESLFRTVSDEATLALRMIGTSNLNGLPTNARFGLLFNKPLNPLTVDATSVQVYDDINKKNVTADIELTNGNRVIELSIASGWSANADNRNAYHRVEIGRVEDTYGNALLSSYPIYFYTANDATVDNLAPTIETLSPLNGTTDVGINAQVHMRFSESINPLTFNPELLTRQLQSVSFSSDNKSLTYIPHQPFTASTAVTVAAPAVTDNAGNALTPYRVTFTTASSIDITPPTIEKIFPLKNATVPVNAVLKVRFNESIVPDSVNASTVKVYDTIERTYIETTFPQTSDYRTFTIIPSVALAVGRQYRVEIRNVRDMAYNQMSSNNSYPYYYHFTTSFEADTEGPTLLDLSIPDGAVDIPTNAVLEMQFDEPLSGLALNGLNLLQGSNIVPLQSRTLSDGNRRVRLHLASLLEPNTAYVLQAKDTVDSSGNLQSTPVDTGFTTGSGAELTAYLFLTDSSPYSGQGGVPLNGRITLKYNQRLNPLTLSALYLYDQVDRIYVPIDINLLRPDTIVIIPKSDLVPNRSYRVGSNRQLVSLTGITDYYYNSYPSFTTTSIDNASALTVTNWSVPIDYSAMPLNGRLVLSFDAALDYLHCPVIDHVTISDGSNNIAYSWTVAETEGRQRLELIPSEALQANTSYTVTVNGLCDIAGNSLTTTVTRSFTTTADTDTTPPRLVSASPADGETGIGLNTPVVWTFSEPVLNTAYAYVYVGNHSNKLSGSLSWNADSTELTFTPSIAYPANTVIGHNIYYSYIYDLSNNVAYRYDLYSQAFTTELGDSDTVAPTVTQVIPQDGAVDINRSNRVVLSFSESLDYSTLTTENIGLYANGQRISTTVYRSYDNQSVTLDTSSVPANSVISVIVTDGVKDLAGNSLSDFISVYSTAVANETVRPTVKGVYPSNGAESVQLDKNIVLFTSEAMNIATVTSETLRVSQNGVLVTGRLVVSGDAQVITFTPDEPWSTDSIIEVFATNGLQDVAGNALEHTESLFRTVSDEATLALRMIGTSNLNGLPTNARFGLLFNKPLNPLTVDATSVQVYDDINKKNVTADIELTNGNRVIELSIASGWSANADNRNAYHRVEIGRVEDTYGNALLSSYPIYFYTANDATVDNLAPTIETLSPLNGTTDVGINAQVHMRFSESINPLTFNPELLTRQLQSVSFSSDNKSLTYIPHQPFTASTAVTVAAPAVTDNAGNALTPYRVTFTTASSIDITPPTIEKIFPLKNATVPVNAVLKVRFNESIVPDSVNASTVKVYDTIERTYIETTFPQTSDYRTFTIIPSVALAVGRQYRVEIRNVRDMAYNQMSSNNSYPYYYHFTTSFEADTEGPTLLDLSIPDGAVDIPTNAVLEMQFDEPLSGLALNGLNLLQGSNIVPLQSRTLSDGNRRVRLHLASLLEPNTAYVLQAKDTVDSSGNLQSTPVDTGFTTGSGAELTAYLFLTDSSPYSGQGGVPLNGRITLKYNQRLNPLTLSALQLYDPVDRVNVPSDINLLRPDTIVITPKSDLVPNRSYRVGSNRQLVSLTGITDYYYNSYPSFTTTSIDNTSALTVTNWNVPIDYSAMPLNGRLILSFDAVLDYLHCPVIDHVTISDGSNNIAYSWTVPATEGRQRLRLIPKALQANTTYTVTVNGLCDIAGNSLTTTVTRSFTTTADTDTTPPRLVSVSPANGKTGVGLDTPVVWIFSEPVFNAEYAYVYVGNHNNKLSGSLSWNADNTELTFTPSATYPVNTVIGHSIDYINIYDLSNNVASRYGPYSQAFTTE